MEPINMLEAKTSLSRLVEAVESGAESEVIIARHGRPAARLVAMEPAPAALRVGIAAGLFDLEPSTPELDLAVGVLFTGDDSASDPSS